ncbi:MAG: FHA domain-containing protein [Deltaproteobacteria bacterium]|nr:MAG: FHA domain-containing protein [Deltaproteobacteria bacterium]
MRISASPSSAPRSDYRDLRVQCRRRLGAASRSRRVQHRQIDPVHDLDPGRGLSARHCLLERRGRKLLLRDLDSSHGTFVRQRKLEGSAELSPATYSWWPCSRRACARD